MSNRDHSGSSITMDYADPRAGSTTNRRILTPPDRRVVWQAQGRGEFPEKTRMSLSRTRWGGSV